MLNKERPPNGPYISTVLFCEKVLREVGDIPSAIRIIDQVTIVGKSEKMEKATIECILFFLLKAGNFKGKAAAVSIEPVSPSGKHLDKIPLTLEFQEGPRSGLAAEIDIQFIVTETGTYWWHIFVDGQLMASTPILVLYRQLPQEELETARKKGNA